MGSHMLNNSMASAAASLPLVNVSGSMQSMRASTAVAASQGLGGLVNMSGSLSSQGGWARLASRQAVMPEAVVRLAGTAKLLKAAAWELHGRSAHLMMMMVVVMMIEGSLFRTATDYSVLTVLTVRSCDVLPGLGLWFCKGSGGYICTWRDLCWHAVEIM